MNSKEFQEFLDKKASGTPLNLRDIASAVGEDEQTLLKFMVDNDYEQVWRLLHMSDAPLVIGKTATFVPNKARAEGEIHLLFVKKDFNTLNQVITQFVLKPNTNNWTSDQALLQCLEDNGTIKPTQSGYMFNVTFND